MSQLELLFGRVLTLPDGEEIVEDLEHVRRNVFAARTRVELVPVVVDLSPAQSRWMGRDAPAHPGCPGCLLFGCCALHDSNEPRKD